MGGLVIPSDTIWRHVQSCVRLWRHKLSMLHRTLLVGETVNQLQGHQHREEEEFCSGHRHSIAGRRNEAAHTTSWKYQFPATIHERVTKHLLMVASNKDIRPLTSTVRPSNPWQKVVFPTPGGPMTCPIKTVRVLRFLLPPERCAFVTVMAES